MPQTEAQETGGPPVTHLLFNLDPISDIDPTARSQQHRCGCTDQHTRAIHCVHRAIGEQLVCDCRPRPAAPRFTAIKR
jgi:hypothetical protein